MAATKFLYLHSKWPTKWALFRAKEKLYFTFMSSECQKFIDYINREKKERQFAVSLLA